MSQKSEAVLKARRDLIQQTLDKICEPCVFRAFKKHVFVVLSHLWLHNIAKEEGLFDLEEWAHPQYRDQIIEKIEVFLNKYIR
ncbi:MAG: hypothetical protein ACFE8C_11060 [Promethearchaeota archaeon]